MSAGPDSGSRPTAFTLGDYANLAAARLNPSVWDFIEGGAGEERTLAANRQVFDRVTLRPRVLTGHDGPDLATEVLHRDWPVPVAVAPMAYHTLMDSEGELATVRAAGAVGCPVVVSTFASRTIEELAAAATSPLWLQVYCFRDRATTLRLIERAEQAGFEALVLTVDAPHLGRRLRDLRNGFTLPDGVVPANLPPSDFASPSGHSRLAFDPALDWSIVAWLRSVSTLPVLVKGILTAEDARRAVGAGVDGIIVSNHGGRQLDGVPPTLAVLPEVVAAVAGQCPVLLDGGVRRGSDVLAALALGARAVLLGRPVLHGLAVGGADGVGAVLQLLVDELADVMTLGGYEAVAKVDAGAVDFQRGLEGKC